MKYITFERDDIELALLFPELVQHREAAKALRPSDRILGAGFCSFTPAAVFPAEVDGPQPGVNIRAWGASDGLNISSRGQADAASIRFTITLPTMQPAEAA